MPVRTIDLTPSRVVFSDGMPPGVDGLANFIDALWLHPQRLAMEKDAKEREQKTGRAPKTFDASLWQAAKDNSSSKGPDDLEAVLDPKKALLWYNRNAAGMGLPELQGEPEAAAPGPGTGPTDLGPEKPSLWSRAKTAIGDGLSNLLNAAGIKPEDLEQLKLHGRSPGAQASDATPDAQPSLWSKAKEAGSQGLLSAAQALGMVPDPSAQVAQAIKLQPAPGQTTQGPAPGTAEDRTLQHFYRAGATPEQAQAVYQLLQRVEDDPAAEEELWQYLDQNPALARAIAELSKTNQQAQRTF